VVLDAVGCVFGAVETVAGAGIVLHASKATVATAGVAAPATTLRGAEHHLHPLLLNPTSLTNDGEVSNIEMK
jgi:hypothetical protein